MKGGSILRKYLWERQDRLCLYCQEEITDLAKVTIDHVVPRRVGGGKGRHNLVVACTRCNHLKGGLASYEEALNYCRGIMRIFDRITELGLMKVETPEPRVTISEPTPVAGGVEVTITAPKPFTQPTVVPPPVKLISNTERMKYDWSEGARWRHLSVEKPQKGDIGIYRVFDADFTIRDPLCNLFSNGGLTGQALEDAKEYCFTGKPSRKSELDPQKSEEVPSEPSRKIAPSDDW